MSPSESEEDKLHGRTDPICLFRVPHDAEECECAPETYVGRRLREKEGKGFGKRKFVREKEDLWLRRRGEARLRKNRRNLSVRKLFGRTFLDSVDIEVTDESQAACEKSVSSEDAGQPDKQLTTERYSDHWPELSSPQPINSKYQTYTIMEKDEEEEESSPELQPFSRRSSVPEEVMRKYSLTKAECSEESLAFVTPRTRGIPEITSNHVSGNKSEHVNSDAKHPDQIRSSSSNTRISGIQEKCSGSQSPKSETDAEDGRSAESSSPLEFTVRKGTSTSENLSSESEEVKCTCAELTSSKGTSTDIFFSGNSTLSQSVSDKTFSTQDSTVSINSVSTGGSSGSVNSYSNSTSPDIFRKSAKGTRSPERTPRSGKGTGRRFLRKNFRRTFFKRYPKHRRRRTYRTNQFRPVPEESTRQDGGRTDPDPPEEAKEKDTSHPEYRCQGTESTETECKYSWSQRSREEMYAIQQMWHRKFVENFRRFSVPIQEELEDGSLRICADGSAHRKTEESDDTVLIPRYSAVPRTLSMLVNTSSGDNSAPNSDSDSLSLVDSLEEFPVRHLSYDTKNEMKPVRGDVRECQQEPRKVRRCKELISSAFFVPFEESSLRENLSGFEKLPEPPQSIKNRIIQRQQSLAIVRKLNAKKAKEKQTMSCAPPSHRTKTKKASDKVRDLGYRTFRNVAPHQLKQEKSVSERSLASSKIPVRVPSPSTSTSPEREINYHRRKKSKKYEVKNPIIDPKKLAQPMEPQKKTEKKTIVEECKDTREEESSTGNGKPQAVIHPSQIPVTDLDASRKSKMTQIRSSKFRQLFEVIPEEKSSSISSTDEKKSNSQKTVPPEKPSSNDSPQLSKRSLDVPNLVIAKLKGKSLQAIPCLREKGPDSERSIFFLSSKNLSSTKGRDALIPLNREDFKRLSKGWMNFYVLKEKSDASEPSDVDVKPETSEDATKEKKQSRHSRRLCPTGGQTSSRKNTRSHPAEEAKTFDFATTEKQNGNGFESVNRRDVKDATKGKSPEDDRPRKPLSLPELETGPSFEYFDYRKSKTKEPLLCLPKVAEKNSDCDGTDSDSTVYRQPPSITVPKLVFEGSEEFPSDGTASNSEVDEDRVKMAKLPGKHPPPRRRTFSLRPKQKIHPGDCDGGGSSGWSVTVAGTLDLSALAPDLEMRLSFPAEISGPPQASHSDSGFTEDVSFNPDTFRRVSGLTPAGRIKQRWTVTVSNPSQGGRNGIKLKPEKSQILPDLGRSQARTANQVLKEDCAAEDGSPRSCIGKISIFWPKVELVGNDRRMLLADDGELTVRGNAVSLERKPRAQTMSEKDVTRGSTAVSYRSAK